ncbi:MAG: VCBS repeat-containing protein [Candidatus Nitrohelix vancouverensis]|uniref:VCBS repeat-containing protein n=1 Tax=Candidatus Nitrohelix vancouverensis TaxID=2705534 RepID=A0A7T0C437_9BACT|nr:MAG: VCBS repeat-containing protein [Candidatus Nitrohelix vancouverensis]
MREIRRRIAETSAGIFVKPGFSPENPLWLLLICAFVAACNFQLPSPPPPTLYKYNVIPVGKGPSSLVSADFNQDGYQDIVSANSKDSTLTFLPGKGDGTFKIAQTISVHAEPTALAVGDFNQDGFPDIAVNSRGSDRFSIVFSSKEGFSPRLLSQKTGTVPLGMIVADLNNDGILDVATTLTFDKMEIYLGRGAGYFKKGASYLTGSRSFSGLAEDFDGDGIAEIVLATSSSNSSGIKLFQGNGDGTFSGPLTLAANRVPLSVIAHDMNQDGRNDLVFTAGQGDNMYLALSKGDGSFEAEQSFSGGGGPFGLTAGNFNDDDLPDVAVANSRSSNFSLIIRRKDGGFIFPTRDYIVDGGTPLAITSADYNDDGLLDVAVASNFKGTVEVYLQRRIFQ